MAKTTAERQAAYRASRAVSGKDGDGQRRVSIWLDTGAALALKRLARRYAVTQQASIERLLLTEDKRVLDAIPLGSEEWKQYFGVKMWDHQSSIEKDALP